MMPKMEIYNSRKIELKKRVMEAAKDYCDMIDCLDDDFSIGLIFDIKKGHCKIKIDANIEV